MILAILAVDAMRSASITGARTPAARVLALVAGALCAASIVINGIGAFSQAANDWNSTPENIDCTPERLWSWRRPQFLAPFIEPEGPFPLLPADGLRLGTPDADTYLGPGWAYGEGEFRWTEGRGGSAIRFSLPTASSGLLELDLRAYLVETRVSEQRLVVSMNDRELATFAIRTPDFAVYRVIVPSSVARRQNVLRLRNPEAVSPAAMEGADDRRQLGVAVRKISWRADT